MSEKEVKTLILCGEGINCEDETQHAFGLAGAKAEKVLVYQVIKEPQMLDDYKIFVFPGGFAMADDLGAGKALAVDFENMADAFQKYIESGRLMLGICNGFQTMVKFGILPGFDKDYRTQRVTLTYNDSGMFEDRWVHLDINQESPCVFTQGIERIELPVRHREGKFCVGDNRKILTRLYNDNQIIAYYIDPKNPEGNAGYPWNPNGSEEGIAGICDPTGRVAALMPHPEGHIHRTNHPRWTREKLPEEGAGMQIFRNAVRYARDNP